MLLFEDLGLFEDLLFNLAWPSVGFARAPEAIFNPSSLLALV